MTGTSLTHFAHSGQCLHAPTLNVRAQARGMESPASTAAAHAAEARRAQLTTILQPNPPNQLTLNWQPVTREDVLVQRGTGSQANALAHAVNRKFDLRAKGRERAEGIGARLSMHRPWNRANTVRIAGTAIANTSIPSRVPMGRHPHQLHPHQLMWQPVTRVDVLVQHGTGVQALAVARALTPTARSMDQVVDRHA